jgi:site-specific DNA-methyltransferase (adenine-specific)
MATTSVATAPQNSFTNQILHDDCIEVMKQMPANSVDYRRHR